MDEIFFTINQYLSKQNDDDENDPIYAESFVKNISTRMSKNHS